MEITDGNNISTCLQKGNGIIFLKSEMLVLGFKGQRQGVWVYNLQFEEIKIQYIQMNINKLGQSKYLGVTASN